MTFLTTGTSAFMSGESHSLFTGQRERLSSPRRGVIYAPGLTGTAMSWFDGSEIRSAWLALANHGFRVGSITEDIEWGNGAICEKLSLFYNYGVANWGFKTKVHLFAASGGAAAVLNWARHNQGRVGAIALVIPAVDIQDIYDNQRVATIGLPHASFGPQVAYGGARPPDDSNPADFAETLSGIPIRIWSSSSDTVCLQSTHRAFVAESGGDVVDLGAVSHTAMGMRSTQVMEFFRRHGQP